MKNASSLLGSRVKGGRRGEKREFAGVTAMSHAAPNTPLSLAPRSPLLSEFGQSKFGTKPETSFNVNKHVTSASNGNARSPCTIAKDLQ